MGKKPKYLEYERDEIMKYFLGKMVDLYAYYDEIEPNETLVITIDVVQEESTNESFGFSNN